MTKFKRYYYDCPIKASYMWQYFGIKTYVELHNKSIIYDKYIIEDWNHRELQLNKKHENFINKYFVLPEYNDTFQPIIDDVGVSCRGDQYFYTGEQWLQFVSQQTIESSFVDIIFRKKQFFMPELELKIIKLSTTKN